MSLGFKRAKKNEKPITSKNVGEGSSAKQDSLFETEWDEFVIRFDHESKRYRVGTSSDDQDRDTANFTFFLVN
jgi:hypothetical protein